MSLSSLTPLRPKKLLAQVEQMLIPVDIVF